MLVVNHRFERLGAARYLRRQTAEAREPTKQRTDRTLFAPFAIDPFIERRVNHRNYVARIGENRIREIAVANLSGAGHVEWIDKDRPRRFFVDGLSVALGKSADDDDVFAPAFRPRVLRRQHDSATPPIRDEFF